MSNLLEYAHKFESYLLHEKKLSENTSNAYFTDILDLNEFILITTGINISIDKVTKTHIRSWLANMYHQDTSFSLSAASKKRKLSAINSFYKYLLKTGVVTENPARLIKISKRIKRLPVFLEQEEMDRLIDKNESLFPEDLKGTTQEMIVNILYQTGMRRSELAGLKNKDINHNQQTIKVLGKGNKERLIPISDFLLSEIKNYELIKENNAVHSNEYFLSLKPDKQVNVQYIYRTVKEYMAKVSTINRKSPHVLRHTFATHLLNNGADISVIKDLLGHESLAATQIYTHTDIEKLKNEFRKAHPRSGGS